MADVLACRVPSIALTEKHKYEDNELTSIMKIENNNNTSQSTDNNNNNNNNSISLLVIPILSSYKYHVDIQNQ